MLTKLDQAEKFASSPSKKALQLHFGVKWLDHAVKFFCSLMLLNYYHAPIGVHDACIQCWSIGIGIKPSMNEWRHAVVCLGFTCHCGWWGICFHPRPAYYTIHNIFELTALDRHVVLRYYSSCTISVVVNDEVIYLDQNSNIKKWRKEMIGWFE